MVVADWLKEFANVDNDDQTPPKKKRRVRKEKQNRMKSDSPTRKTALQAESIVRKVSTS